MGNLSRILQRRSPVVHPLSPDETVATAVAIMTRFGVGALPIVEGERLVGIFSERDLLRQVVAPGLAPDSVPLRDVMTADPITAGPREARLVALEMMRSKNCRHLPIVADGVVVDMLSMRDLLFDQIAEHKAEIDELREYILS